MNGGGEETGAATPGDTVKAVAKWSAK